MTELFAEAGTLLFLLLVCGTKFLTGPAVVLAAGYGPVATIFITFLGGSLGCVIFFYTGSAIFAWWERYFPSKKKKRIFSRKNRALVRFKNKFGVYGLAAIIPIVSIPVSCFISAKYFRHDRRAIPAYILATAIYSVLITLFSEPIIEFLKSLF